MVAKCTADNENATVATSLELFLKSWESYQPKGYIVPESIISGLHQAMACTILDGTESPVTQQMAEKLMHVKTEAHMGQVHFLKAWRAFSMTRDLLLIEGNDIGPRALATLGDRLSNELEKVRDTVLDMVESVASNENEPYKQQILDTQEMAMAMKDASITSTAPEMWLEAEKQLCGSDGTTVSLEDVTDLLILCSHGSMQLQTQSGMPTGKPGMPVFLHIYDASLGDNVHKLNRVLANKSSPLKLGGVFHAGIEVGGLEWSFGATQNDSVAGVHCVLPQENKQHRYRQTLQLRPTLLAHGDIARIISDLLDEYPGHSYDLLRKNCCHFANDFAKRIGAGCVPSWVHRLARVGAFVDDVMERVGRRSFLNRLRRNKRHAQTMQDSLNVQVRA
eukprot:TRINITY_DN41259_c0_g1_i1.p1 TRINITY_DN41259_c0_g1~~TRINITY_DN41259_c0_g1_i1.p1  ORF type:complete len:392 (+),score=54.80 TRINITY_DN41259_c0_g1_i1:157-1332(+)